ncbi:MAG: hypothetical protein K8S99_14700 [Planctomycetes bacterium]|nr:hypothetical protein [Planctomycetota bacterium]
MKPARILREKINSGKIVTGAMATFHFWPGLVEITRAAGMDYLIIDLEHLAHPMAEVAIACDIGRMIDFPVLIRPPAAEMVPLRLAMDAGPCGMLVPYVEGPETMNVIRDAVLMKPRGKRRPGGPGNRWVPDYNYPTWVREVEDDFIILPQIESKLGLANADKVAADPLTTAIAIGPYDLSADLGVCWDPSAPLLTEAMAKIKAAGKAAGKNMWMIGDPAKLVAAGFTFLCVSETTMAMEGAMKGAVEAARAGGAQGDVKDTRPLP